MLVFATVDPLDPGEKRALADVTAIGRERLGALFSVEAISIQKIFEHLDDAPSAPSVGPLTLDASVAESGDSLWVGTAGLEQLYNFLKSYRTATGDLDRIYEKNVRRYLGGRRKVNSAMRKTLEEEPEHFGLFNNGITLVAVQVNPVNGGLALTTPYIVNGCQTTQTVWEVLNRKLEAGGHGDNSILTAWRKRLGRVVVKVVKVATAQDKLLDDITTYTNSQNAVTEKDFVALHNNFQNWQTEMEQQYGMFLEIQRGGWDSKRAYQRQHPNEPQFREAANAFALLKVYGAGWLGHPGLAFGKNPPFLPLGKVFKQIVDETDNGKSKFSARDLYAAFRLHKLADDLGFGRGAKGREKPTRGTSRYLFYFVFVQLLVRILKQTGRPHTLDSISSAILALLQPGQAAGNVLGNIAADLIDGYLAHGASENSVDKEPNYPNNLNHFLKGERFGHEATTPKLWQFINVFSHALGMRMAGQEAPRDRIVACLPPITPPAATGSL